MGTTYQNYPLKIIHYYFSLFWAWLGDQDRVGQFCIILPLPLWQRLGLAPINSQTAARPLVHIVVYVGILGPRPHKFSYTLLCKNYLIQLDINIFIFF